LNRGVKFAVSCQLRSFHTHPPQHFQLVTSILPAYLRSSDLRGLAAALLALACWLSPVCQAQQQIANAPAPIRFLLSFDDGPSGSRLYNSTEQILDALAQNSVQPGIKALFFVQTRASNGGGTEIGQQLLRRENAEGHLLAFHTSTAHHLNHRFLSEEEFEQSLQNGIADLTEITGAGPKLVRPPFWNYDERTLTAYEKHGMHLLLTDLNANDGKTWGFNFSLTKHHNMLKQLREVRESWRNGTLPAVDGSTPIVVTFHDINSYTANHVQDYLEILLEVAKELDMPTASQPFYNQRTELEQAALARTVRDGEVRPRLPGIWNWLWQ
jgi:peptidoglycan/xylan/chitin deacetylase (PgdA/CDA1 family)